MTNDLYEAPIKSVYSKVLSMANLSWIVGLLCLSVPYNVCWSLGNGNFGYDILNTIYFAALGIFLFRFPVVLEKNSELSDSKVKPSKTIGYLNTVSYTHLTLPTKRIV